MSLLLPPAVVRPDGTRLHLQHWGAGSEPARGTVLIVHGLGEHIGRYERVASRLSRLGFHVAGYDQRGHGLSTGPRGALPHPLALLEDLGATIDIVQASLPTPLLLLGHSLGGLVAARFVAGALDDPKPAWQRELDGLILSSPALDAGLGPAQRLLLGLTRGLLPNLALGNGLKPEWLSHDAKVVREYREDPLVHDRITPRLAAFIVDSGAEVLARAARWSLPTLLMWAGSDRCVAPAGSAAFAAAAPQRVVSRQTFPSLYHEIFNEPEQQLVFECMRAWMRTRY